MHSAVFEYLAQDHFRIDELLHHVSPESGVILSGPYDSFRRALNRHIRIEEDVILPAVRQMRGGKETPLAPRIRLDHSALIALMVPFPDPATLATLLEILVQHHQIEEEDKGLYELVEGSARQKREDLLTRIVMFPETPVKPPLDKPGIADAILRAVEMVGYRIVRPEDSRPSIR
jgi:hypothetical protein